MSVGKLVLDYLVRGYDCGYRAGLQPLALGNFLQEAAGAHAASLGIGMEDLKASGMTWMLSRIDLRIDRLPGAGEAVRVRTWPSGIDRLFALRDLVLETPAGESLVRAVYAYLVVDIEARKPLRPNRALERLPIEVEEHAVPDYAFGVGEAAAAFEPAYSVTARPRHIDENGHVNNAHLVDWLLDAAPRSSRGSGRLLAFKVNFLAEALENEVFEASWAPGAPAGLAAAAVASAAGAAGATGAAAPGLWGQCVLTELRRRSDGLVAARALAEWL